MKPSIDRLPLLSSFAILTFQDADILQNPTGFKLYIHIPKFVV